MPNINTKSSDSQRTASFNQHHSKSNYNSNGNAQTSLQGSLNSNTRIGSNDSIKDETIDKNHL